MENISMLFGIGKVLSINENNKTNSNMVGIEKKRIMKYPSSGYGNEKYFHVPIVAF